MPVMRLKEFLDKHDVRYVTMLHAPAPTAQEVAAAAHIPGKELAKSVMVKLDGEMAMAVVPASYRVDLQRLGEAIGKRAELATEEEFRTLFPECELGAMPPFGNLWGIPVYVSDTLAEDDRIAFNAGNHAEVMMLSFDDYRSLVQPQILPISVHA